MRLPCKVIEDLLPLYHDKVCSKETAALVEEHLSDCESCRELLDSISKNVDIPKQDIQSVEILKKIKKELLTKELRGLFLAIAAVIIFLTAEYLLCNKLIPVSTDIMNVTQVSTSIDGVIGFHLTMLDEKDFDLVVTSFESENGILYIKPLSTIIDSEKTYDAAYLYYNPDTSCVYTGHNWEKVDGNIRHIYIGTASDRTLIWEEGMPLPDWPPLMALDYQESLAKGIIE